MNHMKCKTYCDELAEERTKLAWVRTFIGVVGILILLFK